MSEPLWTALEAAEATGGRGAGEWRASGVSIDTRTLKPGDLFVALSDRRDGHDFVAQALQGGAAAALVSRRPEGVAADAPLLVVDDVLEGLRGLGAARRAQSGARVLAITGSVGKTSTKDMARVILSEQMRTHAAEASYNNHWGVPLTLARMPRGTEAALVEIGMNHPGEIAPLARLARPDVALVTTVAAVHLDAFEDVDAIAREKAEIYAPLGPDGVALVNADLEQTPILRRAAQASGARIVTFGREGGADWRLEEVTPHPGATVARASSGDVPFLFKLMTPGAHMAANALAALAGCVALGADLALGAQALGRWRPYSGRGTRETLSLDAGAGAQIELIDDAYNANPASVGAALDVLIAAEPAPGGRRIAVLGDMLELGRDEGRLHAVLAEHPGIEAIDRIHCAGPRMRALWERLPHAQRGEWCEQAADMAARAHALVGPGDIVLVKGSKGARTALVVDAIRELSHRHGSPPQQ